MKPYSKIGLFVLLAILVIAAILVPVTSRAAFCKSCHEMQNNYSTWQASAHRNVECISCHVRPGAVNLILDKIEALREVVVHFTGPKNIIINQGSELSKTQPSENCTSCHPSPGNKSDGRVKFVHDAHKDSGLTCAYCHNRVAHPGLQGYKERITMPFCIDCHRQKGAPASCTTCHPPSFDLKPSSHKQGNWIDRHSDLVSSACFTCHENRQKFCDGCHGLAMPHPKGWKSAHAEKIGAGLSSALCAKCHVQSFCDNCHRSQNPHPAGWLGGHISAAKSGAKCDVCHAASFCSNCHQAKSPHPANWLSTHPRQAGQVCLTCHNQSFCSGCHARSDD